MAVGWIALTAAVAISLLRKQRIGLVQAGGSGLRVGLPGSDLPDAVLGVHRLELAQTLRYLADLVWVLALLAAVGLTAPNRPSSRWLDASPRRTVAVITAAAAVTAAS